MSEDEETYTVDDLMEMFHVTRRTIYRWIEERKLPEPIRQGHRLLWARRVILALKKASNVAEILEPAQTPAEYQLMSGVWQKSLAVNKRAGAKRARAHR